jgi:hypothetical protein
MKTLTTSMFLTALAVGGAAFAADNPISVLEMTRSDPKPVAERGSIGSKTRPEARPFSGTTALPLNPAGAAKSGSPATAQRCSGCSETTVAIKSAARFATFQPGAAKTVSRKAVQGTAGAPAGSARAMAVAAGANLVVDPRAQMIDPPDGSILNPTQSFEWSAGYGVADYYLWIGSCFECNDLLNENEGQNLIRTVTLPVDGRMIYVALFSWIDNAWYEIDYQFQAAAANQAVAAQMVSPTDGATLNSPQIFRWNAGYSVNAYYLQVGSCEGCNDVYDAYEGGNLSDTVNLPADGRTVYSRLWSLIASNWYYYDYQYRAPQASNIGNSVRVNINNPFAYPVNVFVNGQAVGSVPAFTTAGTNVAVASLSLAFELVQPTLNGRTLGDPVSGVFQTIANPSGTYLFQLSNQIGNSFYFLPLITNQTSIALAIEVNGGLQADNKCGCEAPANSVRVAPGYYLLFSNSNVRLFPAGANYTGVFEYFGTTANPLYALITDPSAEVNLVVTQFP